MIRTDLSFLSSLASLAPLILLSFSAVLVMVQIAVRRHHPTAFILCLAGLGAAFAGIPSAAGGSAAGITTLVGGDAPGLFFTGLIILSTAATALIAYGYLERLGGPCEEFYLLLLMAAAGAVALATSRNFASLFIGLEILSISLYTLVAYPRHRVKSLEAGLKYLVLAAVSAAFLLFGTALIYTATGTLSFTGMQAGLMSGPPPQYQVLMLFGTALLVTGVAFKLALVPFHMWIPDVYQNAPAPVTAFVATVSKAAVVALLVHLFLPGTLPAGSPLFRVFGLLAIASMTAGNLLALFQTRVKRILAYSSIAHMGYLLVAFMAGGAVAVETVTFYTTAYVITTLGAFGIITVLSGKEGDADDLENFRGLFFRHPWLGGIFTAMLLSLAGIPMTVGFIGKFYLVATGIHGARWWLVMILLITSGISVFYYLRIVVVLFSHTESPYPSSVHRPTVDFSGGLVLALAAILLVWLGIAPETLLNLIH